MNTFLTVLVIVAGAVLLVLLLAVRIVKQYERGVLFRLGRIAVDKNSTVVFPAPLMSTIGELGAFLSQEAAAASRRTQSSSPSTDGAVVPVS